MGEASGFLNINKSTGYTSHDIVSTLRKSLGIKKIGHSGTLDPFATGVLVIGINKCTRLFEYLKSDKEYISEITFGMQTNTDDITGEVIETNGLLPAIEEIEFELTKFKGKIKQKPPIYSAIKINGRRAHNLARDNKITLEEIKEREVEIFSISFISFEGNKLKLKIHCSSGTYIRSIARDLGLNLKTFATLSGLQRTCAGDFKIKDSVSVLEINKENLSKYLIEPSDFLSLEKVKLDNKGIQSISMGKSVRINNHENDSKDLIQIVSNTNEIIGIGKINNGILLPKKVLNG